MNTGGAYKNFVRNLLTGHFSDLGVVGRIIIERQDILCWG